MCLDFETCWWACVCLYMIRTVAGDASATCFECTHCIIPELRVTTGFFQASDNTDVRNCQAYVVANANKLQMMGELRHNDLCTVQGWQGILDKGRRRQEY